MRFTDSFLDEVRARLPISQVVGEHVIWDKRKSQPGRGDYWACCPFHSEKTPSFHVDDKRGRYHCFGCKQSGDIFRFLTERTGVSFPEAVEKLAGQAGVAMPARDARSEQREAERRSLIEVMDMAAAYFEAALSHNIGARARGYLNERGVVPALQTQFRIGFAPESRNGLKEHLAANGVSAGQMAACGLVVHGEDIAVPYDRFRNRVMFPITDMRGRIIGFGGRALSADIPAKYLNSPETELFRKRATLYNGQDARQAAHEGKPIVVVEGYLDVIAAVAAGFRGTVAPLGTALTEEQLGQLWRMSDTPVLCFDGDSAGQKAADRAADLALPLLMPGRSVRIASLPGGEDPDDLIRRDGPAAFAALIEDAAPLSEAVWVNETRGVVPQTPEARAALEVRLRERVNSIGEASVRRHYGQAFDEKLKALFAPVRTGHDGGRGFGGGRREQWRGRGEDSSGRGQRAGKPQVSDALKRSRMVKSGRQTGITPRQAVIVMTLVNHPGLAESRLEMLAALDFTSRGARDVLVALIDIITAAPGSDGKHVREALFARGLGEVMEQMEGLLQHQGVWQSAGEVAEIDAETGLKHALALHYKSVQLNRELKAAEIALGQDPGEESFERLRDIQSQISSVDGTEALIEGFGSLSGRATRNF